MIELVEQSPPIPTAGAAGLATTMGVGFQNTQFPGVLLGWSTFCNVNSLVNSSQSSPVNDIDFSKSINTLYDYSVTAKDDVVSSNANIDYNIQRFNTKHQKRALNV